MHPSIMLAGPFAAAAIQNAAFTAVSRSRNGGDAMHHAVCSVASNSFWFPVQILMWSTL